MLPWTCFASSYDRVLGRALRSLVSARGPGFVVTLRRQSVPAVHCTALETLNVLVIVLMVYACT